MKKLLFLFAILLIAAGAAFAGQTAAEDGAATAAIKMNPPGTYPIVDEMITFDTIGYYSSTTTSGNPGEAAFADYIAELTNVRLNWVEMIEATSAQEKFNLILASGDLPEILIPHSVLSAQQVYQQGSEGAFRPLNDLIPEFAPDMWKALNSEEGKPFLSRLTMPDGNIYAFPDAEAGCFHCQYSTKMWIYTPWMEKLGIETPETTEDFYQMLKAFKEGDPNGNGKADEMPLLGATTSWRTHPMGFIMNSFIFTYMPQYGNGYGAFLKRDGNKASFVADADEYREGLKYMKRLYDEELLASESFVWTQDESRQTVENPDIDVVGAFPAGWYGVFTFNGSGSGRFADFDPIAPLEGPAGVQQSHYFPPTLRYQTEITRETTPEKAKVFTQYLNWYFEDVARNYELSNHWWHEGEQWRYTTQAEIDAGWVSRDGLPAVMTRLEDDFAFGRDKYDDAWLRHAPIRWTLRNYQAEPPEDALDRSKQEYRLMIATRDLMAPYKTTHYMPPDVVFSTEVEDELTDLVTTLASNTGLIMQRSVEFISGVRDIYSDAEWENFKKETKRAGVDRYVEIWNEALSKVTGLE